MIDGQKKKQARENLANAVWKMVKQAPHDLGGEQRDFYLPLLRDAFEGVAVLFPEELMATVERESEDPPEVKDG